jgi:oligopeptide transport system ATP-binding protein
MPLLECLHLSKSFPIEGGILRHQIGSVQALRDVSLSIAKGETLAVVGGSGCGKSTLARIITGLVTADTGTLLWEGQPLEHLTRQERARRIQMVFQDPFASLNPKLSVGTQLAEVVRLAAISDLGSRISNQTPLPNPKSEIRSPKLHEKCEALLKAVGLLEDALSHYPFQFSGGQRQRIAIARALALQPKLLVADEPLSALDVTIQAQILQLFKSLKKEFGLTILFITHDLTVVESFADRVLVIQDGRAVEEGPSSQVLSKPKHPYTQELLAAVPRIR